MKTLLINLSLLILLQIPFNYIYANHISPNGGYNHDFWVIGDTVKISWNIEEFSSDNTPISIKLWNGNTLNTFLVADDIEPSSNYYYWLIPIDIEPSNTYRIILTQNDFTVCNDNFISIFHNYPFNRNVLANDNNVEEYSWKIDLDLIIYPNPATDVVVVRTGKKISAKIRISDVLGFTQLSKNFLLPSDIFVLDVSTLPIGTYYLQLFTDDERTKTYLLNVIR